jgi:hypothetical protein
MSQVPRPSYDAPVGAMALLRPEANGDDENTNTPEVGRLRSNFSDSLDPACPGTA